MAELTLQAKEITVKAKSKSGKGIMDASETWYNASKNVTLDSISKGDKVQIHFSAGEQGGFFIHKFVKLPTNAAPKLAVVTEEQPAAPTYTKAATTATVKLDKPAPADSEKMTKADWAKKDADISNLAVLKAVAPVVAAMAPMKTVDEVEGLFVRLFHKMQGELGK
jgi:hypothetical protein